MVAVAETVLERPEPWRPPRASHIVFGATTIVAIIALVAILVPMVSGARVSPRHAPEVFLPPLQEAQPFDGWQQVEHKIKHAVDKGEPGKATVKSEGNESGGGGGSSTVKETHVSQTATVEGGGPGIAINVNNATNTTSQGDDVSTSNHSSTSSHSVVTSNSSSSHVSKGGTSRNSVNVHSSSRVIRPSHDDGWDDSDNGGSDDWQEWQDNFRG
jgi:hypothetical protein